MVENFIYFLVFFNTLILSLDGLLSKESEGVIVTINTLLTYIFTLEMVIKLFGLGFRLYVKDSFNIFDGIIVILSIFELLIRDGFNFVTAIRAVRVFRAIRVLRVTRLLRSLRFMKVIIEVIMASIE